MKESLVHCLFLPAISKLAIIVAWTDHVLGPVYPGQTLTVNLCLPYNHENIGLLYAETYNDDLPETACIVKLYIKMTSSKGLQGIKLNLLTLLLLQIPQPSVIYFLQHSQICTHIMMYVFDIKLRTSMSVSTQGLWQ